MEKNDLSVTKQMELKLSSVLTRLLRERGMTLKELAQAINAKPSTLSGWKNGVTPRDMFEVRSCARFFGVSIEKLLFDETSEIAVLESLLTEEIFEGFLKVKIERVIKKGIKK